MYAAIFVLYTLACIILLNNAREVVGIKETNEESAILAQLTNQSVVDLSAQSQQSVQVHANHRQPHFIFPDHVSKVINLTLNTLCQEPDFEQTDDVWRMATNEECARHIINMLESRFPAYIFMVAVFSTPQKCESSCLAYNNDRNDRPRYNYNCNCQCKTTKTCSSGMFSNITSIWGYGSSTIVGNFNTLNNESIGYFVYMVKSPRKISTANVEVLSSMLNCTTEPSKGLQDVRNGLLNKRYQTSDFGLISLIRPQHDLQILTTASFSNESYWIGSVLCDATTDSIGAESATGGFHIILAGASQQ